MARSGLKYISIKAPLLNKEGLGEVNHGPTPFNSSLLRGRTIRVVLGFLFFLLIGFSIQSFGNLQVEEEGEGKIAVRTGLDVLVEQDFKPLWGKRVGIIADHTSITKQGEHIATLIFNHPQVTLGALFVPESSLEWGTKKDPSQGFADLFAQVPMSLLAEGIPRFPDEILKGLDVLIYNLQDIGIRSYPGLAVLVAAMQLSSAKQIPLLLLDRPNPINGNKLGGPLFHLNGPAPGCGYPIPILYGLTPGELAQMMNGEGWLGPDSKALLEVIPMEGWQRRLRYDETDLPWIPPFLDVANLEALAFYPGLRLLDEANLNVGQGTIQPYLKVGAPWIESASWSKRMNSRRLPGLQFWPTGYEPVSKPEAGSSPKYAGQLCQGLIFQYHNKRGVDSIRLALYLLFDLAKHYPEQLQFTGRFTALVGETGVEETLRHGVNPDSLIIRWQPELREFVKNGTNTCCIANLRK